MLSRRLLPLLGLLQVLPVDAESARGTMLVSVTVLATCEVSVASGVLLNGGRVDGRTSAIANVNCAGANPYHVSLASRAGSQPLLASADSGQLYSGSQQLRLSQLHYDQHSGNYRLSPANDKLPGTDPPAYTLLVISY